MNELPLISIITSVYNDVGYLEELIRSVLRQEYPHIEHIVIDDGSDDGGNTIEIIRKYPHLKWWSRENKGQYASLNDGLLVAAGVLVCFISADDILLPNAAELAVTFLRDNPNFDGVFGNTAYMDDKGNPQPYFIPFRNAPISFVAYLAHISHCSLFTKRDPLIKYKLQFDPSLHYVGDYEWMIRLSKSQLKIGHLDKELSIVRLHREQTSHVNHPASSLEKRMVIHDRKINRVYYLFVWSLYVTAVRIWKVKYYINRSGVRGLVRAISEWFDYLYLQKGNKRM